MIILITTSTGIEVISKRKIMINGRQQRKRERKKDMQKKEQKEKRRETTLRIDKKGKEKKKE